MIRIIDSFGKPVITVRDFLQRGGTVYEVTRTGDFKVKAHDLGHGHLEVSYRKGDVFAELEWERSRVVDHLEMMERHRENNADEIAESYLRKSANRAKTRARKLCKANGVDTMLTLTYRANEQDLARCKNDLKRFADRMQRVLPGFGFIAFFERQDRGAWHVHMATCRIPAAFERVNSTGQKYKVKSFDVIRAIWRSVTKEREGNIDVSRSKRSDRTSARIASYMAKYIAKAFAEGEKGSNRWTKYGFSDVPEAVDMGTCARAVDAFDVACAVMGGRSVATNFYSHFGDWGFIAFEVASSRRRASSTA